MFQIVTKIKTPYFKGIQKADFSANYPLFRNYSGIRHPEKK